MNGSNMVCRDEDSIYTKHIERKYVGFFIMIILNFYVFTGSGGPVARYVNGFVCSGGPVAGCGAGQQD